MEIIRNNNFVYDQHSATSFHSVVGFEIAFTCQAGYAEGKKKYKIYNNNNKKKGLQIISNKKWSISDNYTTHLN